MNRVRMYIGKIKDYMEAQGICGKISFVRILLDIAFCTLVYGATISDYFLFRFYEKKGRARKKFMTARDKNRFYTAMNDAKARTVIQNKDIFNVNFAKYLKRDSIAVPECGKDEFCRFLMTHEEVFIKPIATGGGEGIQKLKTNGIENAEKLFSELCNKGTYVIEEAIIQHPDMAAIHPESTNSLRISTYCDGEDVKILFALLRCGTGDSFIDNHMKGGMVMIVDQETGRVASPASCKKCLNMVRHPDTGVFLPGFQVPHWDKVVALINEVATQCEGIHYVGWDVAILKDDVSLIEANPSGDFNLYQEPMQTGCRDEMNALIKAMRK